MTMTYKNRNSQNGGTQVKTKKRTRRRLSPISKRTFKSLSPLKDADLKYVKPFKIVNPLPQFKTGDVINLSRSKTNASELQITGAKINPSSGKYEYTVINLNSPDKIITRNVERIDKLYVKNMLELNPRSASNRLYASISRYASRKPSQRIIT